MAPIDITKENEAIVWDKMYNVKSLSNAGNIKRVKSSNRFRRKAVSKFKINDYVRLAYTRYTFQRDYQQKWTTELFKVFERFLKENLPLYKVVDMLNDEITGNMYEWKLMKADKDQEFWRVQSILRTRKKKRNILLNGRVTVINLTVGC